MILQKNYKANLTSTLASTNSWEIEVRLNIAPVSETGFLLFEPWVAWKEETCYYHRISWTYAYIYWVNRDNPTTHAIWSSVMLSNSIDTLNYLLDFISQAPYIFKKTTTDIIIKWWQFYINNVLVTINDIDTSVDIENKVLIPNKTNYITIKDNDYFINDVYNATLYPIADIVVDWSWVIISITKHKFKDLYNLNWYAPLDSNWKVPFSFLPAVFASILEFDNIWEFPLVWDSWILYTVEWSSIAYRWDWDSYVAMSGIWDMFTANNLSDLTNTSIARDNLNVYSQIETDNLLDTKLSISENLNDLEDKAEARTNLNVYSKSESILANSSLYENFTAWENLNINNLFRFWRWVFTDDKQIRTWTSVVHSFDHVSSQHSINFTTDSDLDITSSSVWLRLLDNWNNVTVSCNVKQWWTIIATSNSVNPSSTSIPWVIETFTFWSPFTLTKWTNYTLEFNSVWNNIALQVYVYWDCILYWTKEEEVDQVYKANSTIVEKSNVIWIVKEDVLLWNTFKWLIIWVAQWFTWLTLWEIQYLKDDWTIWDTQWTIEVKLWKAISATKINFITQL